MILLLLKILFFIKMGIVKIRNYYHGLIVIIGNIDFVLMLFYRRVLIFISYFLLVRLSMIYVLMMLLFLYARLI